MSRPPFGVRPKPRECICPKAMAPFLPKPQPLLVTISVTAYDQVAVRVFGINAWTVSQSRFQNSRSGPHYSVPSYLRCAKTIKTDGFLLLRLLPLSFGGARLLNP